MVLERFGKEPRRARAQYHSFVADGVDRGRRPEFQGGGLIRSVGGWTAVRGLQRGREGYATDERILGAPEFVEQLRREIEEKEHGPGEVSRRAVSVRLLIERVSQAEGVRVESVEGGGRRAELCRVREGDSVSGGGVVRAEWVAAGSAIGCEAGVSVSGCTTR